MKKILIIFFLIFFFGFASIWTVISRFSGSEVVVYPTPDTGVQYATPSSSGSSSGNSGGQVNNPFLASIIPSFGDTGSQTPVYPYPTPVEYPQQQYQRPVFPGSTLIDGVIDLFPQYPHPLSPYSLDFQAWFLISMVLLLLLVLCLMSKLMSRKKRYEI